MTFQTFSLQVVESPFLARELQHFSNSKICCELLHWARALTVTEHQCEVSCYVVHCGNTCSGTTETFRKWLLYDLHCTKHPKEKERRVPSWLVSLGGPQLVTGPVNDSSACSASRWRWGTLVPLRWWAFIHPRGRHPHQMRIKHLSSNMCAQVEI